MRTRWAKTMEWTSPLVRSLEVGGAWRNYVSQHKGGVVTLDFRELADKFNAIGREGEEWQSLLEGGKIPNRNHRSKVFQFDFSYSPTSGDEAALLELFGSAFRRSRVRRGPGSRKFECPLCFW